MSDASRYIRNFLLRNFKVFDNAFTRKIDTAFYLIKNSEYFARNPNSRVCASREEMYSDVLSSQNLADRRILYLEYGVFKGAATRWWTSHCKNSESQFVGFDWFQGLPETWDHKNPQGSFSAEGQMPKIDDGRLSFEVGLFQETLRPFIEKNRETLSSPIQKIVNLDADLYSSTLYVLVHLMPFLRRGDLMIFDDFFTVRYGHTEFRAFLDFSTVFNLEFEEISKTYYQIAFRIK